MSTLTSPPPPTSRRLYRYVITKSPAEVVRGASAETLARPAGEILANVPWEGLAPDPHAVPAAVFLGWL